MILTMSTVVPATSVISLIVAGLYLIKYLIGSPAGGLFLGFVLGIMLSLAGFSLGLWQVWAVITLFWFGEEMINAIVNRV